MYLSLSFYFLVLKMARQTGGTGGLDCFVRVSKNNRLFIVFLGTDVNDPTVVSHEGKLRCIKEFFKLRHRGHTHKAVNLGLKTNQQIIILNTI